MSLRLGIELGNVMIMGTQEECQDVQAVLQGPHGLLPQGPVLAFLWEGKCCPAWGKEGG